MTKVISRIPIPRGLLNISNWFSMPTEDAYSSKHLLLSDWGRTMLLFWNQSYLICHDNQTLNFQYHPSTSYHNSHIKVHQPAIVHLHTTLYTNYVFMYVLNEAYNALLQEMVHQDEERYSGNENWNTITAGAEGDTIDHAPFRSCRESIYSSIVSF